MDNDTCYCDGTYRQYMTHKRRGEDACPMAKASWARYYRERRNKGGIASDTSTSPS